MQTTTQLFSEKLPAGFDAREVYTITLSPGVVRYLRSGDLFRSDIEAVIAAIADASETPKIKSPEQFYEPGSGIVSFRDIDDLVTTNTWENKLRDQHAFGQLFLNHKMPWSVYRQFHSYLRLKTLRFDKCLESCVQEATGNRDVAESFQESPQHLAFEECVFLKTPFVLGQLALIAAEDQREAQRQAEEAERAAVELRRDEEARRSAEDLDRLRKSNFRTFVYVMEDLRNGSFKIGHSKTPSKRERTLQSEVPSVTLRFSIPSDEKHERLLHEHFDRKNLRGEWFLLTADELLWIISFLKTNGDTARALVDYEWLGKISFQSSVKHENKT